MLTLTNSATETIETLLGESSIPDGAGVRIAPSPEIDAESVERLQQLELTLARAPVETDQVIDDAGARVFVDQMAADFLDDKLLDARRAQDRLHFRLETRPE